tara:strand:- start:75 stop:266 length:192 start_codon:yes stop_codon:yes gene_type:complete
LGHLKGLSNLDRLSLWRTDVTGTGFSHLMGMTELQQLILTDTQVTHAGVADLKKTLPSCTISR